MIMLKQSNFMGKERGHQVQMLLSWNLSDVDLGDSDIVHYSAAVKGSMSNGQAVVLLD